jgi:CBS domain containing-hemolysin-like protein
MVGLLLLAAALVLANAFFVAAEFALVRVRSTQLDLRAGAGSRAAVLARSMMTRLDAYLSACQLGITLASLGLGWVGEPAVATALRPLFEWLQIGPVLAHRISIAVGFTLISALHIIVGEQAPKNLAIAHAERTSLFVAWPLRVVYLLFYPFLRVVNGASNALLRAFGVVLPAEHSVAVRSEELRQIAAKSAAEGQITAGESALLSKVFTFSDRVAREIMVPRHKVSGIDLHQPLAESLARALESGHSRYPLYDQSLDGVVGVLHMKDLTRRLVGGEQAPPLRELVRPPVFVPETLPAQRLLRMFQRRHSHMAFVLDEYGSVTGIVTIEDALEQLVGEIQDEHDDGEIPPVVEIEGGYSVEGRVLLVELAPLLGVPPFETESSTIAGYVMERLGRLGEVGDSVVIGPWRARIVEVQRRAIERIELTRVPPQPEA